MAHFFKKNNSLGSGCGSVGRVVASNTRDPQFESSSHRQILFTINCIKDVLKIRKKKEKEAGTAHFLKKQLHENKSI